MGKWTRLRAFLICVHLCLSVVHFLDGIQRLDKLLHLDGSRPKRRAPSGNGCRSVRSLSESGSDSLDSLVQYGTCTHAPLIARFRVWSAPQQYGCTPVSCVRIPSYVLSIPRPIASPILLRHLPLRSGSPSLLRHPQIALITCGCALLVCMHPPKPGKVSADYADPRRLR
jgi:hypothetical protein